ncbi:MAG: amidohydrolase family protein [Planctomycetota bacterium]
MILRAAWVAPVGGPVIRDGEVEIAAGRIVAVGPVARTLRAGQAALQHDHPQAAPQHDPSQAAPQHDSSQAARQHDSPQSEPPAPAGGHDVLELGNVVLTPGLVNAHTHLELTCYAGLLRPAPFWEWIPELARLRAAAGQVERERAGVAEGAWQSLRAGVTCVGDISRRNLHWPVLKTLPLRKVCFVELLSLADHPPRNPEELRAAVAQVEEDDFLTVGIAPHAPYSVPGEQIRAAVRLAGELGRPWCTHWAETREERGFLLGDGAALPAFLCALLEQCGVRPPGCSAIPYLEECCAGGPPGLLAHVNYVEGDDAARLAAAGHTVVYCPRAHHFFGHPPHPYRALLASGVRVVLGTDSLASNESLSLLAEARHLRRQTPDAPPPDVLLRMMTLEPARALGLGERIGSLEPGKAADLAAFPWRRVADGATEAAGDPIAQLIDDAPAPVGVWVSGARVL